MATITTYKRLGATTITTSPSANLYTVPADTSAVISTICICNRGSSSATYKIAHVDGGIENVSDEDYIVYDATINANDSGFLTIGATMEATHSILVESDSTSVNFIAWGSEVS
jgi:hypothetical protein